MERELAGALFVSRSQRFDRAEVLQFMTRAITLSSKAALLLSPWYSKSMGAPRLSPQPKNIFGL
jgi:hypothetical protein